MQSPALARYSPRAIVLASFALAARLLIALALRTAATHRDASVRRLMV
jgi:hypothetical protein